MDEDNSTRLAEVFEIEYQQLITIFPYVWKHLPYGNWFLAMKFKEN